ncbi:uncharacterized protein PpBr36_09668 [Pyricularia pennisetigena]|uniref:uncharacterized protein n=1 Tax=Pyricularia pennisetigena TaxID=1578925 RepID=UPI00114F9713|nr:uncharacterized protein PpBr36_09668 [Pyricularia pennisetigena]TLS21716.1 hypothetical protein PpBr36_09668 [Pyricularia pennisetigena]
MCLKFMRKYAGLPKGHQDSAPSHGKGKETNVAGSSSGPDSSMGGMHPDHAADYQYKEHGTAYEPNGRGTTYGSKERSDAQGPQGDGTAYGSYGTTGRQR